jgi:hypothetical protein
VKLTQTELEAVHSDEARALREGLGDAAYRYLFYLKQHNLKSVVEVGPEVGNWNATIEPIRGR